MAKYILLLSRLLCPEATAAIRKALEAGLEMGQRARHRIVDNYPLEKRRQKLLEVIEEMREGR